MVISIEYLLADASTQLVKSGQSVRDAIQAIQGFAWDQQAGDDALPEVHFVRRADNAKSPDDIEAYASVMKNDNDTWMIVAGARKPGRMLGFIPVTKNTDIILDELGWQSVSDFFDHFYQDDTGDLFAWMKERDN